MKTFLPLASVALIVSSVGPFASAQHYTQINLVANTSGVAPLTDPHLVNPWDSPGLPVAPGGYPTTALA